MSTKSLGGNEYILTFVDDKTRYTWIYAIQRKHQVYEKLKEWKAMVEKSTGKKLKVLRTDNDGEYVSKDFEGFLTNEGIKHEHTIPITPEQNGVAERINRTVVETARSMLCESNLPKQYWAEAVSTAVYLRN